MKTIVRELPADFKLLKGAHTPDGEMCVMEAVAFIAGEPWSDHPQCASKVISSFLRSWNDAMNDEDRQQLKPLIPRLVGTAGSAEVERRRSYMALDWLCRVSAPAWLRLIGKDSGAAAIESCASITDIGTARAARQALDGGAAVARAAVAAAWAAARAAAGAAAGAALRPTVFALQQSALELVERMITVQEAAS